MNEEQLQQDLQVRLRRIEGQVRGIQRMLGEGRVCEEVITQLMAVRSGLDQVALHLIELHLQRCILADLPIDESRIDEIRNQLKTLTRIGPLTSEPLPQ